MFKYSLWHLIMFFIDIFPGYVIACNVCLYIFTLNEPTMKHGGMLQFLFYKVTVAITIFPLVNPVFLLGGGGRTVWCCWWDFSANFKHYLNNAFSLETTLWVLIVLSHCLNPITCYMDVNFFSNTVYISLSCCSENFVSDWCFCIFETGWEGDTKVGTETAPFFAVSYWV